MLVMANCSLARSRVDIALLVGLGGGVPGAGSRGADGATTPVPGAGASSRGSDPGSGVVPLPSAGALRRSVVAPRVSNLPGERSSMRRTARRGDEPRASRSARHDPVRDARRVRPPLRAARDGPSRRLLARLDRAPASSLVLLVAPGGYGKTTVLSQWVARPPPCAPGSTLDRDDNDPESPRPAHRSRAAGRAAAGRGGAGLSDRVPAGSRPRPGGPAGGRGGACVASVGPPCSSSTTCTRSGSRASLTLVRTVLDEGAPALRVAAAGRTSPDLGVPDSSPPVAASSSVRPTSPSPRRRRVSSSPPAVRR